MSTGDDVTSVKPNLEVVFDHLYARRSHDLATIKSQLDPDAVHQGVLPELICRSRDEILENVRRSFARDDFGVDHLEMIDAGDRVVVGFAGPRFREVPWTQLHGQLFMVFTVRDGRIVRIDDYLSRAEALVAAAAAPDDWS